MKKLLALASAVTLASLAQADSTVNFKVNLNLAGRTGTAPFGIQVDLIDPQSLFGSSSVSLSSFVMNGGAFSGVSTLNGLATGNLGTSATLSANNSTVISSISRDFNAGVTSLSFNVSAASDLANSSAHGLSIFVYDSVDFLNTASPSKAFVTLDVNGGMNFGNIATFNGSGVTASVSAVPEPSTYGLMGAGAAAAIAFVRRRKRAAASAPPRSSPRKRRSDTPEKPRTPPRKRRGSFFTDRFGPIPCA